VEFANKPEIEADMDAINASNLAKSSEELPEITIRRINLIGKDWHEYVMV
jgi:hypothetical protein